MGRIMTACRSQCEVRVRRVAVAACLALLFLFTGPLISILKQTIPLASNASRLLACKNSMKQIGLALLNYQIVHDCFPPAYLPDEDGRPMHSWRVLLLPFIDEQTRYDQYRFGERWDSPHNLSLSEPTPRVYQCWADPPVDGSTSYVMVVGPNAFSTGPEGRHVAEFTDGLPSTLAVVEMVDSGIHWMEPRDWDPAGAARPASAHPGVFNALFADGAVRSLDEHVAPDLLEATITVDGGEAFDRDRDLRSRK